MRDREGPAAVADLLHPDNHPPLPLVELNGDLNPFRADGVRIFAKAMYLLPLLSINADTPLPYLEKYSTHLDASVF